ncbi:GNAT family N-acetyltransferase [Psychrosphaera sp. 1_MG-2023]|uniref:GNAT family N-acetyltransferase n=1 Tax=Psychrosphaera sp. 1_MG-2023 TaxID=3062643 RepID=UPI0026E270A9|nr:GNAT family N-acetyltransferase [Psychrosphaera sp. 1_MG-2023]MDO6718650.1 GNAT family N-acetyltransferase [Psychrosphaera sp. 1_MG-2023]
MVIRVGGLEHKDVIALLQEHHGDMLVHSPPESVHALDISGLKAKDVTFWSLWIDNKLAGIGALKELNKEHGEIKSMRTSADFLRQGMAQKLLTHLIHEANQRSYKQLSLETGTAEAFIPAQQLYLRFGFKQCPPFGQYIEDPYSMFMTKFL